MIIGIQLHNQVVTTTTATGTSCDALNHNQGDKEQDDKDRGESYLFPRHWSDLLSLHFVYHPSTRTYTKRSEIV
jgi:hypothetical protein